MTQHTSLGDLIWVLATGSPRRHSLFKQLGYSAEIVIPETVEKAISGETPGEMVRRLAEEKALAVSQRRGEAAVFGFDTEVFLDGIALGKPDSLESARQMLRLLNNRSHSVWSGAALAHQGRIVKSLTRETVVIFRNYGEEEIDYQLLRGEPLDKAGGYAIQSAGARLVKEITGCYYNVVGLPIFETIQLAETARFLR